MLQGGWQRDDLVQPAGGGGQQDQAGRTRHGEGGQRVAAQHQGGQAKGGL